MLRFILERHEMIYDAEINNQDFYTIDIDVPEIESALTRGWKGEGGFERNRLIGVEIVPNRQG